MLTRLSDLYFVDPSTANAISHWGKYKEARWHYEYLPVEFSLS
jgi:hypothetical protein